MQRKTQKYTNETIVDAFELWDELVDDKGKSQKIKWVETKCPYNKKVRLIDLSLSGKGMDEDKMYALNKEYRNKIRRGNTLIEVDKGNDKFDVFWGRKGFRKFFDIHTEYLDYNMGKKNSLKKITFRTYKEHVNLREIIFAEAEKLIKGGESIQILKTVKANGECCQFSWSDELNCWVIASKNVGMLLEDRRDIKLYKGRRYSYSSIFAEAWFNKLENFSKSKIDKLKNFLSTRTIIGEYCGTFFNINIYFLGNQDHQHLVKYDEIDLIMFIIVDHNSPNTCIPPYKAYDTFDEFGFTYLGHKDLGTFDNWKKFNDALYKVYGKVSSNFIEDDTEGSVLYFIHKSKKGEKHDTVVSLSKLKTLEYRIYRKLREKLRNFISKERRRYKTTPQQLMKAMKRQTKELCRDYDPPMPYQFYYDICWKGFDFAEDYPRQQNLIHERYVTFISVAMYCWDKDIPIKPKYFKDKKLLKKIMKISWKSYSKNYDSYSSDDDQSIELDKKDSLKSKKRKKPQEVEEREEKDQNTQKNLIVFVPLGIPGMGKTHFVSFVKQICKEKQWKLQVISSDEIRRFHLDRLMKKKEFLSFKQAFDACRWDAISDFWDRLEDIIGDLSISKSPNHAIFLDKNHTPQHVKDTLNKLYGFCRRNVDIRFVAVTPKCISKYSFYHKQNKVQYPFSLSFFFQISPPFSQSYLYLPFFPKSVSSRRLLQKGFQSPVIKVI